MGRTRYVIVDLEATCDEANFSRDLMETIEIGAVVLPSSRGPVEGEFACFVKPFVRPTLTDFCTQLTSIQQSDVDAAEGFPEAFARFVAWAEQGGPFTLASWGAYDARQLQTDCERCNIPYPASFSQHLNVKKAFEKVMGTRPPGMPGALRLLNLELEGRHHRGIDDAHNIARIAMEILPRWERGY